MRAVCGQAGTDSRPARFGKVSDGLASIETPYNGTSSNICAFSICAAQA